MQLNTAGVDDEENRQEETEQNKATTLPKAKSVFLIFCKALGTSKIGLMLRACSLLWSVGVKWGGDFSGLHKCCLMTENEP